MPLEKVYLVINVKAETKEINLLELLDETSQPPNIVKRAVFWLGAEDDFKALGNPSVRKKVKVTLEILEG